MADGYFGAGAEVDLLTEDWGRGTGLLDEDGKNLGPLRDFPAKARAAVAQDLDAFAAKAKGLALETDLADVAGQDVAASVETTDLAVALDNLLSNAVTYTEEGTVTVRVTADDEVVEIAVADTGIGIPPADVERVFERFYRVDRARSRTSGGTGLGLALVRNVAERAGGAVEIESEPGVGTTVTLRLRRAT